MTGMSDKTPPVRNSLSEIKVQIVDPSAFTPPYDRALAAALARAGAEVELLTSKFLHGDVPPAEGFDVDERFYRRSAARGLDARARLPFKAAEHLPDMLRLRRALDADVVHYQWLTAPPLDALLLGHRQPRLLTAHYILPPGATGTQVLAARLAFARMDAVVAHSEHSAARLRDRVGLDPAKVRVIPHGAFDYLTRLPTEAPLPPELEGAEGPVILCFGLLRPYKGTEVLLEAFAQLEGAELWIVGNPRMDLEPLRALAAAAPGRVRFLTRFVAEAEIPAIFRRADVVALPYLDAEHSGVLYTGLAFGKPLVLSAVGGFPEVAATGAARLVPPDDARGARRHPGRAPRRRGPLRRARRRRRPRRRRPLLLGRGRPPHPRPLPRADRGAAMTALAELLFWLSAGLIVYTHVGYPVALWVLLFLRRPATAGRPGRASAGTGPEPIAAAPGTSTPSPPPPAPAGEQLPLVSLIVPAYDEEEVIAAKVADALALEYPRERLQLIVASDGSGDATAERAREAGADLVLELPAGGKLAALDAAVGQAEGELLAFSDANSRWQPDALRRLIAPFADPAVGYVCGQVRFVDSGGDNLEGAYWRYEMSVREMESALAGVTAGNGAIYAVRRDAYLPLGPAGSHDLSFPFALAKRGLRSLYAPTARAEEKMVPTLDGELARKRRMMVGIWDIVVGEGMISPRGYPPLYAFELASHRLARYLTPFLHLLAFLANLALLGDGWFYYLTFVLQLGVLGAALLAPWLPGPLPRIARYYVMTTAAIALGLWDRWRQGSRVGAGRSCAGNPVRDGA